MSTHLKAFIVMFVMSYALLKIMRPTMIQFIAPKDYETRARLWLILVAASFLSFDYWLYFFAAATAIYFIGRKDSNPASLYIFLLMAVPPLTKMMPGLGILDNFFYVDQFRMLAFVILIPAALKLYNKKGTLFEERKKTEGWRLPDFLLCSYVILQIALYFPYVSFPTSLKSAIATVLEILLPYYVISRISTTKSRIEDLVSTLALAAILLSGVAIFENLKGWLLYADMGRNLGASSFGGYLYRGDQLRAEATSGQAIVLGYFLSVGLGCWLHCQAASVGYRKYFALTIIIGGLISALSRGPWIGAGICVITYLLLSPNPAKKITQLVVAITVASAVILASPYGKKVIDYLPFVGTIDVGNITYREAIIERAWLIIQLNPFLGSPYFQQYMEDFRTGVGVIDLLNVYLSIGMAYGLITLSVFLLFFIAPTIAALKASWTTKYIEPMYSSLGASLIASIVGIMVIIYTTSNYLSIPIVYIAVIAMMVGYRQSRKSRLSGQPG